MVDIEMELAGFTTRRRWVLMPTPDCQEEFQPVLPTFPETLYAERHSAQVGGSASWYHPAQEMAQETLIIPSISVHPEPPTHQLAVYAPLETYLPSSEG